MVYSEMRLFKEVLGIIFSLTVRILTVSQNLSSIIQSRYRLL